MGNGNEPKKPRIPMPREQLEQYIIEFIKSHNVCVLATAKDNVPRATALEYEAEGTTLYIMADPGTKTENIKANPQVSAAIHNPLHGFLTVKGIQITGKPRLITDTDAEYPGAWKIYNRANAGKEGWDIPPEGGILLVIEAQRIDLLETALKDKGYKTRQAWEAQA